MLITAKLVISVSKPRILIPEERRERIVEKWSKGARGR